MARYVEIETPIATSIFHASDFSMGAEHAFAHALALSLLLTTRFSILHAGWDEDSWQDFPAVRNTLQRWELLDENSERASMLEEFDLRVRKVRVETGSPIKGMMSYLKDHETDLIVLSIGTQETRPLWLRSSLAEKVTHKTQIKTLFVPEQTKGFVSLESGIFDLDTIVVPIDRSPDPIPAVDVARRLTRLVGNDVTVVLLHVGTEDTLPDIPLPTTPGLIWKRLVKPGDVKDAVYETTIEFKANLIVMATQGRHGFLDALYGSVTEQVLRIAPCPLLAVPMD